MEQILGQTIMGSFAVLYFIAIWTLPVLFFWALVIEPIIKNRKPSVVVKVHSIKGLLPPNASSVWQWDKD